MCAKTIWVIVLSVLAAVCQLIAVRAAWRELRSLREHGEDLRKSLDGGPIARWLATTPDGINVVALNSIVNALKNQWAPSKWSVWAVGVAAPVGIAAALTATFIGLA